MTTPIGRAARRSSARGSAALLVAAVTAAGILPAVAPGAAQAAVRLVGSSMPYLSESAASASGSDSTSGGSGTGSDDSAGGKSAPDDSGAKSSAGGGPGKNTDGRATARKPSSTAPPPTPAGADTTHPATGTRSAASAPRPAPTGAAVPPVAAPDQTAPAAIRRQVTVEPGDQTVQAGDKAVFTAKVSPSPQAGMPVIIRWQTARGHGGSWSDVGGATGPELHVTAEMDIDGSRFRAEVTGEHEAAPATAASAASTPATSAPVSLHVTTPAPAVGPAGPCPTNGDAASAGHAQTGNAGASPPLPAVSGTAAHATGAEPAAAPCPDAATRAATYGTVTDQVIDLGQQQTAVGHNFAPGTRVKVTLEPGHVDLGTAQAAQDGTVTTHFDTSRLLAGQHTVNWTPLAP